MALRPLARLNFIRRSRPEDGAPLAHPTVTANLDLSFRLQLARDLVNPYHW